jgi:GT2 family glycosyltransferase
MITVIMATRNGARTLPEALAHHGALRPAPVPHRLLVVDNGSTDATPDILQDHLGILPLVVRQEPRPGKNRALNAVLAEAAMADLVVLTDDDALPEPDWLCRLWAAASQQAAHNVFGGTIRPRWPAGGAPPRWLADWGVPLGIVYAATSEAEGPVSGDKIWGPNMALRGALIRQGHRFDETVGPDGGVGYAMGSETEFTTRLERAGHRAWFAPEAVVTHVVRPEQLAEAWVLGRAYRHGRGYYRYHPRPEAPLGRVRGVPVEMELGRLAYGAAAAMARRAMSPSCRRFWWIWKAEWLRGATEALRCGAAPATELEAPAVAAPLATQATARAAPVMPSAVAAAPD